MDTHAVSPKYSKKHLITRTCSRCGEAKQREKFVIRRNDKGPMICRECERIGHELCELELEELKREKSMVFYRIEPGSFSVIIRTDASPVPADFKPF